MRYAPAHKQRSREAIVEAAGRVFRRLGYDGASVDSIMGEAGLTRGGFYAHFDSKEDLFAEVVRRSVKDAESVREKGLEGLDDAAWAIGLVERYLSKAHERSVERGCPIPPLISELSRSGEAPRRAFAAAHQTLTDRIAERLGGGRAGHDLARALVAVSVGGVALARAMPDERTAGRILSACRRHARALIEARGDVDDAPADAPVGGAR